MDSCVYQPPAILKVQIYSFTIFEIKSNFSYFYRFFCIPLHEKFHLNFVFGKLHFYLSSQLFFKKSRVFGKESITQILLVESTFQEVVHW